MNATTKVSDELEVRFVDDVVQTDGTPEKVEYVLEDEKGNKTTYDAVDSPTDNIRRAAQALYQLRVLQAIRKRAKRQKLNAQALRARVSKRRKADKAAKASRKKNR